MQDPTLQLMVYGRDIKFSDVSTDYPNARIDSIVRLDSPNYLLVYLNLKDAKPGEITLSFTNKNGKTTRQKIQLKARAMAGADRKGFDNSDVLYMLMPDRFADGNPKNDIIKGMQDQLCNRNEPSLRHGGDLEGIRQHLDYFTDLGVTAFGSRRYWRMTVLLTAGNTVPITDMPPPTTIVSTRASVRTKNTRHLSMPVTGKD